MIPSVEAGTPEEWRAWLEENHEKETRVQLILHKRHTGKPTITHREAMDEAICFGWIDTTVKRIDDEKFIRSFSRRSKNSKWSKATLGYAKRLLKEGRMAPYGVQRYKEGLKKPTIDHGLPKNPKAPADLKQAFGKEFETFETLAPSSKRYAIYWIEKAKKPETRAKRINEVVRRVKENKRPF